MLRESLNDWLADLNWHRSQCENAAELESFCEDVESIASRLNTDVRQQVDTLRAFATSMPQNGDTQSLPPIFDLAETAKEFPEGIDAVKAVFPKLLD